MADQVFLLPDLGEGLTEAELVRWLVAEGDRIVVDQPVAEVETAKSLVEVPSPYAGVVAHLHGAAGQLMEVGQPFLSVGSAAEPESASAAVAQESYRQEERAGSGNVLIGYGTSGHRVSGRSRPRKSVALPPVRDLPERSEPLPVQQPGPRSATTAMAPLVISPLVRRLARELGLRLADIPGSGPGGLILRKDVEGKLRKEATGAEILGQEIEAAEPQAEILTEPQDSRSGLPIRSLAPLSGVRRTIAAAMSRSRSEIPEATVWVEVDATALVALRADLKKRDPDHTPSLLAFIARFVLAGLARFPELNSRIVHSESGAEELLQVDGVNLGFAAQTERGLMVPSIRQAHTLSARELDAELRRLTAVVRAGKASPAELSSGTFTLNNYGVFGVDGSAAIINYPEAAMLGVGRIIDKPWVVAGELAVRKITELTLVFDHRVCDGGTAGGFLRFVADAIENPAGLLADL